MTSPPITILIRKHCFEEVTEEHKRDPKLHVNKVMLKLPFKIFCQAPSFYVVYNKSTSAIKYIVFYTLHGSRFLYG
ncbi:hypothetical protein M441DRAFT_105880, partial [Trichoderma asperellum CBS 433.97]